jgi:hypothetical protein
MNSINSEDENKFVSHFIKINTFEWQLHWLGGKKVGSYFEWNDKNAFNNANWDLGQPNNNNGNEMYIVMYSNGRWHDYPSGSFQFICEKIIIFD